MEFADDYIFEILQKLPSECSYIDYKRIPYTKNCFHDLIKDVIAMLNCPEDMDKDKAIIFGVSDESRELVGIDGFLKSEREKFDDSIYQDIFDRITPRPEIKVGTIKFQVKTFGFVFIAAEANKDWIYEVKETFVADSTALDSRKKFVSQGQAFTRHGSRNSVMMETDRELLRRHISAPDALLRLPDNHPLPSIPSHDMDSITVAAILGSWCDDNTEDRKLIESLSGIQYSLWILPLKKLYEDGSELIDFKNAVWHVKHPIKAFETYGIQLYNQHVDLLDNYIRSLFSAYDPIFDFEPDKRFAASLLHKAPHYSLSLLAGLANFLAIAGNHSSYFPSISDGRLHQTITKAIQMLFSSSTDWRMIATMDSQLSLLAEADPNCFINAVENALQDKDNPLHTYLLQVKKGIVATYYGSSLIHALIILARNAEYFSHACFVAFKIVKIQPDRLSDITTLILPWLPQTGASVQQRTSLVEQLFEEDAFLAWDLLISLLPSQTESSFTLDDPKYLSFQWKNPSSIPDTYEEETAKYFSLACKLGANNVTHLLSLVPLLDDVSHTDFLQILKTIENSAAQIDDEGKYKLWNSLLSFANRHHQFSSAKWALPESSLKEIESTACLIMPTDKRLQMRRLFQNYCAYILPKHYDSYREEDPVIFSLRSKALTWCIKTFGLDETLRCIENFESVYSVGLILAESVYTELCDKHILEWINSKSEKLTAISKEYIAHRFFACGMGWAKPKICNLSLPEQAKFLTLLPITKDVLTYISDLKSADIDKMYWESVTLHYISDSELKPQIASALIKHNRPWDAVELVHDLCEEGNFPSCESIFDLLEQMVLWKAPSNLQLADYHATALIGYLQKHWNDENKLALVEWQYYNFLKNSEFSQPTALYRVLGRDPQAFMDLLCLLYRGRQEESRVLSTEQQHLLGHAFTILRNWNIFPWMKKDDTADIDAFKAWYTKVRSISLEKDRYEIALYTIGSILFYTPADPNGLFIDKNIAEILHKDDNDSIRDGYHTAAINSRGVHTVDLSGKEEFALEEKYNDQARQIDDLGYFRLAEVLRKIAKRYHWEALNTSEEGKKWQAES